MNLSYHTTNAECEVAYLFHTSGTSSGLPKPIPQTHHGAIGVLPSLPDGYKAVSFTTTPLYHGGIADCFRAWTSSALIWLFPGKDVPITASNILKSLGCATRAQTSDNAGSVKYFSSVPYVLQMVSTEPEGMKTLQGMDIVGVGGAALPQDVGDELVHKGVNLVSRFGSAECGFLLSSHRNYDEDKEWQYLRSYGSNLLKFEPQDESGLSELVIQPDWPHMAKRNREDGSFATADIFAPHPTIKNAWKYHSRADSQLTLITGKKFDPAPLEAAIASNGLLSDALIFGNGMQCPGALLFRSESAKKMNTARLLDEIWPVVERLNKEGQAHTRLSRAMLVAMDPEAPGLEKSSKGTVMRAQAEKRYKKEIREAYEHKKMQVIDHQGGPKEVVTDHEVPSIVLEIIKETIGTNDRIPEDADLFSYGVDSVACMAIRAKLQSRILNLNTPALPLNVVYDCGNIKRLSKYLVDLRKGRVTESEDEIQLMKDLIAQYSKFEPQAASRNTDRDDREDCTNGVREVYDGEHVLLTGATGALGAHILHLLRSSPTVSHIHCLVRAASPVAAHERVSKSLTARGKPGLPPFSVSNPASKHPDSSSKSSSNDTTPKARIECIPCTLSEPHLGLSPVTYTRLARTMTLLIHAAWAVNFTARLKSFVRDHIAGLVHLLNFTLSGPFPSSQPDQREGRRENKRFLFLSSTASVTSTPLSKQPIPESISSNPEDASPLGYSRSKWVAESICRNFHNRLTSLNARSKLRIAVLRVGQLCGDTENGIWNMSEAYPLMLSTAPFLHALPDLGDEILNWLPVDLAASSVLEIAETLKPATTDDGGPSGKADETEKDHCPVFHILNPHTSPTWSALLHTISRLSPSLDLAFVPPGIWLEKLEGFEGEVAAKKLVGLWRASYGSEAGGVGAEGKERQGKGDVSVREEEEERGGSEDEKKMDGKGETNGNGKLEWQLNATKTVSKVIKDVQPLDDDILGRMWAWVERQGRHEG
ncbi:MAG: hypothetical protein Q9201_003168 [Fulgogasparrea decipioides]